MATRNLISEALPTSLQRPVLLTALGVPRYWATVYELSFLPHLSDKTTRTQLQAIDALYLHVEERYGANVLDEIIATLDFDRLLESLEAFYLRERNLAVQTGIDRRLRWSSVKHFIEETITRVAQADDGAVHKVRRRLRRLISQLTNLHPNPVKQTKTAIRAVPSDALSELYDIFDPHSPRNPYRDEKRRWRNHCLFLALLHQGLRRGEALLLPTNPIKSGIDDQTLRTRYWLNVQNLYGEEDPRYCDRPSIKNDYSIRQIPVSDEVAARFQIFCDNYRGISPYPQLFLNSSGHPLGARSVSKIFKVASSELSAAAKRSLEDAMRMPKVTAHDLRHTCAVVRLYHYRTSGIAEEEALQKLRAFFGWTFESTMPRLYARAYYERHVSEIWNKSFDSHVDALRSIEHSVL